MSKPSIVYTKTDEAPALATYSFLPIVKAFTAQAGIEIELKNISLASRILAQFPEAKSDGKPTEDALALLGELAKKSEANIIKLPNISASIPQLEAAIAELQQSGFNVPSYPKTVKNSAEQETIDAYAKVLGSAVNPVLREGNSDRRVAGPVKEFAKNNPHSMGEWSSTSKTVVAHMSSDDFYGNEKSVTADFDSTARIVFTDQGGRQKVLKDDFKIQKGEVVDSTFMSKNALLDFFKESIDQAKNCGVLLSLHMKATMMKVSDPEIFGAMVEAYYSDVFEKHCEDFSKLGVQARNGIGDVYQKISDLDPGKKKEILDDLENVYKSRPKLAMVDSDRGITNLHVPSDVIIDASMPAAIRAGGKMWGPDGKLTDTVAVIPDRSYAGVYQKTIEFCKENGAFDVKTMGNVSNVGLMAKKAEEYGSHDKTFMAPEAGTFEVMFGDEVVMSHKVEAGDIFRACQTKDVAIKDWVRLGVERARLTGDKAIFWLDKSRAHDAELIRKVQTYIKEHDTKGLNIEISNTIDACAETLERVKKGENTISVTGNVLRDYLTDLFPILELGTSAKMLSIVPLLAGGGLYETGAGGSAPKHVQQFTSENHLRWDSLGEFLALGVSLEDYGRKYNVDKALVLAKALNDGVSKFLKESKSPSRKVGELDNRGSHFYLAMYWAEALSLQADDQALKRCFQGVYGDLKSSEAAIVSDLNGCQGGAVDIGGYYFPDDEKASQAMRPCQTFNSIIDQLNR